MFSLPIALETKNICEPKGTMSGHNRTKLNNFTAIESDLGIIFNEFIQLPTSVRHALLMINTSIWKILIATSVTDNYIDFFFKSHVILNNQKSC